MNSFTSKALLKKLRSRQKANGFTLIELMVVVAIVGILSGVGLPQLLKAQDKAKDSVALATLTNAAKECSLTLVTENSGDSFDDKAKANYTLGSGDDVIELGGDCDFESSLTPASQSGDGTKEASVTFDIGGIPSPAAFPDDESGDGSGDGTN
tara:strand:+ start:756 stop:1214 length:459 start_codon:yes stop_codon:yes gene_type:complete